MLIAGIAILLLMVIYPPLILNGIIVFAVLYALWYTIFMRN